MAIKLIAQAISFLLRNVKWDSPGPSLSELNHHIRAMDELARRN